MNKTGNRPFFRAFSIALNVLSVIFFFPMLTMFTMGAAATGSGLGYFIMAMPLVSIYGFIKSFAY